MKRGAVHALGGASTARAESESQAADGPKPGRSVTRCRAPAPAGVPMGPRTPGLRPQPGPSSAPPFLLLSPPRQLLSLPTSQPRAPELAGGGALSSSLCPSPPSPPPSHADEAGVVPASYHGTRARW